MTRRFFQLSQPERAERDAPRICQCGAREGLHRWATQWCPNPKWLSAPGRVRDEWLVNQSFVPRAAAVSPLHNP